jgi:hypothetical protein
VEQRCQRCGGQDGLCYVCHPKGSSYVFGQTIKRLKESFTKKQGEKKDA